MSATARPTPGFAGGLSAAFGLCGCLLLIFWATGTLLPTAAPDWATSPRAITGMALMLAGVPAFVVASLPIARRRSLELVEELRPLLPRPELADEAGDRIREGLRRNWPLGVAIGFGLGLLNTDPLRAFGGDLPWVEGSISLGQMLMWCLIGVLGVSRIAAARAFRQLGEEVTFDLFRPERLRPLARSGVVDVVIVAGALLFSPLQSLDAEFRWVNYRFGLLVAVPATAFFLVWPLLGVHARIRADRDARLRAVDAELDAAPRAGEDATLRAETLLAHRDRLLAVRTWPLGTRLISRVLLYLVFPPLAWTGAAIVERLLDDFFRG